MPHQRQVGLSKLPALFAFEGCRTEVVCPMVTCRDATDPPECILQARAQRFETLAETGLDVFVIRVKQHELIKQMREKQAAQRDIERVHRSKIRLALDPGLVNLREKHLRVQPVKPAPDSYPPLKGS